ncbi:MAG: energy-coupling factor ABC transporter ATP-binding protein [Desulfobacteraceae bacterium]|nr:energy-coupling factor ABC transporter ATP-binding protein [Desulfobacteraceae bacterium]
MTIIETENLTHYFSDGTAGIDGINVKFDKGTFVVIAGRNGSGKTTFLRHLNGLLLPQKGVVRLEGIPVSQDLVRARKMVGMVFQDADSQIVGETVYDDAAFGPENLCLDRSEVKKRVHDALEAVGLLHVADQRPHLLSGGEKRKLAVAGILAMNPKVVVFDEPFSNLDFPGIRQVLKQILSLHQTGHTIILTTHDLEKVIAHADRLIVMDRGKMVKDGSPKEIVAEVEAYGVRQPCAYRHGMDFESWLN